MTGLSDASTYPDTAFSHSLGDAGPFDKDFMGPNLKYIPYQTAAMVCHGKRQMLTRYKGLDMGHVDSPILDSILCLIL